MLKAIVCDWNRTLFEDAYEIKFFLGLARNAAAHFIREMDLRRTFRLWKASRRCKAMYRNIESSHVVIQDIKEIVEIMNHEIIEGLPTVAVENYLSAYVAGAKDRLDYRLLRPLADVRERHRNVLLGVISSGYSVAIDRTLIASGYPFDFVKANHFEWCGDRLKAFKLNIYNNKADILQAVLAQKGIELDNVMYIGDDWQDGECLKLVRFPTVSLLADPKNRAHLKREANAYAPDSEESFRRYLDEALS